jgi:tetraacyldisaccharide 4'-kinase
MALRVTQVESLGPQREQRTLASFAPGPVHGVAAIGDPQRFFASLRAAGIEVIEHAATDHHAWVAEDLPWCDHPVLMTPKDAVKCRGFARAGWWQVQVQAELEATGSERLLQTMTALVQRPLA